VIQRTYVWSFFSQNIIVSGHPEIQTGIAAGDEQVVAGTGAGDVEQVPPRVVNFFRNGIIGGCFD
jgi:hypothetical protein